MSCVCEQESLHVCLRFLATCATCLFPRGFTGRRVAHELMSVLPAGTSVVLAARSQEKLQGSWRANQFPHTVFHVSLPRRSPDSRAPRGTRSGSYCRSPSHGG